jgi:hypothetical protein
VRSLAISLFVLAALIAWLIISQPDSASTTIRPPLTPVTSPWYGDRD